MCLWQANKTLTYKIETCIKQFSTTRSTYLSTIATSVTIDQTALILVYLVLLAWIVAIILLVSAVTQLLLLLQFVRKVFGISLVIVISISSSNGFNLTFNSPHYADILQSHFCLVMICMYHVLPVTICMHHVIPIMIYTLNETYNHPPYILATGSANKTWWSNVVSWIHK